MKKVGEMEISEETREMTGGKKLKLGERCAGAVNEKSEHFTEQDMKSGFPARYVYRPTEANQYKTRDIISSVSDILRRASLSRYELV